MTNAEIASASRAILLNEGFDTALDYLVEHQSGLEQEAQDEVDGFVLQWNRLSRSFRKNQITSEQYSTSQSKMEQKLISFLRDLGKPEAAMVEADSGKPLTEDQKNKLQDFVAQGRVERAFDLLNQWKDDLNIDLKAQILILSSQYEKLEKNNRMGAMDYRDYSTQSQGITIRLIELIS